HDYSVAEKCGLVGSVTGQRRVRAAEVDVDGLDLGADLVFRAVLDLPGGAHPLDELGKDVADADHALVDLGLLGVERAGADALPVAFEAVDDALEFLQLALDALETVQKLLFEDDNVLVTYLLTPCCHFDAFHCELTLPGAESGFSAH